MKYSARPRRSAAPGPAQRRGFLWRWSRRLLIISLVVILLSALPVLALRWLDPPGSAYMLARALEYRNQSVEGAQARQIDQRWRDIDQISPWLALAVIASEDQRFPEHHGFDLVEIERALQERRERGRFRGASTITQQLARNLFLWSGQSYLRKGLEAYYALLLELFLGKPRILELYLNLAEFGDGIYGAEAASQKHFSLSASELNSRQAALLAAVLPSPRRFSAGQPSDHVRQRADWIERQMRQLGGPAAISQLIPEH